MMLNKISIAAPHALHACTCHSDSDAQGKSRASYMNNANHSACVRAVFMLLIACHLSPRSHFVVRLKIWDLCQIYHCALHMRLTPCDISLNSTSGGKSMAKPVRTSLQTLWAQAPRGNLLIASHLNLKLLSTSWSKIVAMAVKINLELFGPVSCMAAENVASSSWVPYPSQSLI